MTMPQVHAPWDDDQVGSLNAYQVSGVFHPFTGNNDLLPVGQDDVLVATTEGWRSDADPSYKQTWAWEWMADWSWQTIGLDNWIRNVYSPEFESIDRHFRTDGGK